MKKYDQYIQDVLSGKILANKKLIMTCQRHVKDLKKAEKKSYSYYFDESYADKYISFIEKFRLIDQDAGPDGKKPFFILQPFQAFYVASIFGWRIKKDPVERRFTETYFQVPRKNAKSTLVSACMVAQYFLDKKNTAQFYTAAVTREQAGEVYQMAKGIIEELMIDYPNTFESRIKIIEGPPPRIVDFQTKSFMKPLSREAKTIEGKGGYVMSLDEWHVHKTDDIRSSMKKGSIKYVSPMTHCLTTPGFNIGGPAHVHYDYCTKVLKGVLENERLFIQIYELDENDDWTDPTIWGKPNPGLGISPKLEPLLDEYKEAVAKGGFKIVDFKTKHLGMWVSNASEWIPLELYKKCNTAWNIKDYPKYDAFGALDMAYSDRGDVSALGLLVPIDDTRVKMFNKYYIPEEKARIAQEIDYFRMAELGHVVITPGETTDYDYIMSDLMELSQLLQIRLINFDAWNISYFYEKMVQSGLPVQKFQQSVPYMSPPTKRIGEMIHKQEIDFGSNPVTQWMFSNVLLKDVGNGNVKMMREQHRKIDGAITTVMSYAAWHEYKLNNPPAVEAKIAWL